MPHRFVHFRRIALAVGDVVPAAQATQDELQARVLALRGDWKQGRRLGQRTRRDPRLGGPGA